MAFVQGQFTNLTTKHHRYCNGVIDTLHKLDLDDFQRDMITRQVRSLHLEFETDLVAIQGRIKGQQRMDGALLGYINDESFFQHDQIQIKQLRIDIVNERTLSEQRLAKLMDSLGDRLAMIEAASDIHPDVETVLMRRLSALEKLTDTVGSQNEIAKTLADTVQKSIQEIAAKMEKQVISFPRKKITELNGKIDLKVEEIRTDLKKRIKQDTNSFNNGKKTDLNRLESLLNDISARVNLLETRVADDQEQSIQMLEMLLQK